MNPSLRANMVGQRIDHSVFDDLLMLNSIMHKKNIRVHNKRARMRMLDKMMQATAPMAPKEISGGSRLRARRAQVRERNRRRRRRMEKGRPRMSPRMN